MLKIALTTLVALTPTLSAMRIIPQISGLNTAQTTINNIAISENLLHTAISPVEISVEQPEPTRLATHSEHTTTDQSPSIDPLNELMEMILSSEKFQWQSKLLSLGLPHDSRWKNMSSQHLQSLYNLHKATKEWTEALEKLPH